MIQSVTKIIEEIKKDLATWDIGTKPWFRGESGDDPPLCPKIANFKYNEENYLLQSFQRKEKIVYGSLDKRKRELFSTVKDEFEIL